MIYIVLGIMTLLGGILYYLRYIESDGSVKNERNLALVMWVVAVGFVYFGIYAKDQAAYSVNTQVLVATIVMICLFLFVVMCSDIRRLLKMQSARRNL